MLKLHSLSVQYGFHSVLRHINLNVSRGEVLALVGPNGAGKSTLIRVASGGLAPTTGRVRVEDVDLRHLSSEQRARRVAVVPQAVHLPPAFTALETVLMGRTPHLGWLGHESDADREIALASMTRTSTAEFAQRRVGELSGGEQQRVLIARALTQSAPILLMDEPTAHLDLKHQSGILDLVRGLAHQERLAVLLVLHDLNLAAQYADRVALLANGELRALGKPEAVLTADRLGPAYGLPVNVFAHPVNGKPLVLAQT